MLGSVRTGCGLRTGVLTRRPSHRIRGIGAAWRRRDGQPELCAVFLLRVEGHPTYGLLRREGGVTC